MKLDPPIFAPPHVPAAARSPGRLWHRLKAWVRSARCDPHARRARRVLLLLALLGIMNVFDLLFTLIAARATDFVELNPIAAGLVESTGALVVFKLLMMGVAFGIFFRFRRHGLTEIACWGLCAVYALLAGRWWSYYFLCHG